MAKTKTYISLFSAAGIGCYGFKLEKYSCLATVELLEKRLKIQKYNNICSKESQYIQGDIAQKEILNDVFNQVKDGLKDANQDKLDVVLATPPCQGMSLANHKKKNELPRNSLVIESLKIINQLKPNYFVFENVPSFLKTICFDIDKKNKSISEAIQYNLGSEYIYISKKINFAFYGSQSSRTRSLTIGVLKSLNIDPENLFPSEDDPKNLRELISHLPSLKWGEISSDIFHSFRTYQEHMRPWIKPLKEGMSAFQNKKPNQIPHRIINGKYHANQERNGDKYRRQIWDKLAPCIHTRNDILASQNTVHPKDDRVFSIRELMLMMTIPEKFKFTDIPSNKISLFSNDEKKMFLKKEELNIRHCIGEAVPTNIFKKIAANINQKVIRPKQDLKQKFSSFIDKTKVKNLKQLANFINGTNSDLYSINDYQKFCELLNTSKDDHAAFYTDQSIVDILVNSLPDFKEKKIIRILEPSVGSGNFILALVRKYFDKKITIDVVDINKESIDVLKAIIKKTNLPKNVTINYINNDFLYEKIHKSYALAIGNPPFKKIFSTDEHFDYYKSFSRNKKTNNLFSFFLERIIDVSDFICFIVPKSILGAPEFNESRLELKKFKFKSIHDFGEKAFKGILIETIALSFYTSSNSSNNKMLVSSLTKKVDTKLNQSYVMDNKFPTWLLYRDSSFDMVCKKLNFNKFTVFRDRQITKKLLKSSGKYRVIKSFNVGENKIIKHIDKDLYISEIDKLVVKKYLNNLEVILVPNLTYLPRGCFMPKNSIPDGSLAILIRKQKIKITSDDLKYWSTNEFRHFYRICRNFSTRSMNIDSNYIFYFGILK